MDRDFLFGVIAVQLGQASPAQVMAAASAFVADRSKSIPRRLKDQGVFDGDRYHMIEVMVDDAIKAHGGDVRKTMQSLGGERVLLASFGGSLSLNERGEVSLEAPGVDMRDSSEEAQAVTPESPGRYRSSNTELGRGGIGRVLIAFDEHLGREVAVKELLPDVHASQSASGTDARTEAAVARFLREARVTGQLEHPNIIPVYELGERADGTYYYTMKLVRGRTLSDALSVCESISDRLKLLPHYVDLCHAVAYAHSRGVIHRDIKPDNVMLGEFGETVVVDWGLAKVAGKRDIRGGAMKRDLRLLLDKGTGKTVDGSAIGTPAYMPPEQADGAIDDIDERSDVWSLAAVLYEILTGRPPFEGISPFEIIGKVLKDAVVPPRQLEQAVPAELNAVVVKGLCREKTGRYESAKQLASEVSAYMTGGRVAAYEYSSWELLSGFAKRNRALSSLALLCVLIVLGGSTALYRAYLRAGANERAAHQSEARAQTSRLDAEFQLSMALRDNAQRELSRDNAMGARILAAASLLHNPSNPKSPLYRSDAPFEHPRAEEAFVRAYSIHRQASLDATVRPAGALVHDGAVFAAALSPDGARLASAGEAPTIRLWDVATAKQVQTIDAKEKAIRGLAFSPDGKLLAAGGDSGSIRLLRSADLGLVESLKWDDTGVQFLTFSPDSRALAVVYRWGRVVLWDMEARKLYEVARPIRSGITTVAFSSDGKLLAVPSADAQNPVLWDVVHKKTVAGFSVTTQGRSSSTVAFSASDRWLILAPRRDVLLWDMQTSRLAATLTGHQEVVDELALLPGSPLVISAGRDKSVHLWNTETGQSAHVLEGHRAPITSIATAAGGGVFATSSEDGTVRLWRANGHLPAPVFPNDSDVWFLRFSPDGTELAVMSGKTSLWDVASRKLLKTFEGGTNGAFSPDNAKLATRMGTDIAISDVASGRELVRLQSHPTRIRHFAFSPDGRTLASACRQAVRVWDATTGVLIHRFDGNYGAAFSPTGDVLATGAADNGIRLWDPATGKLIRSLEGHQRQVDDIAYSHNGRWLASSDLSGVVRLWDLSHDDASYELRGHTAWTNSVDFSPNDELLITASDDRDARIWSVASKKTVLIVNSPSVCVGAVFSPDGKSIAVGWGNGARVIPLDLSVRDAAPRQLLETAQREAGMKLDGVSLVATE